MNCKPFTANRYLLMLHCFTVNCYAIDNDIDIEFYIEF